MALTHASPGVKVRLPLLVSLPRDEKTSALVKTGSFEAIHLILRAGSSIPNHAVDGYITLHCLEGAVIVETRTKAELQAGDWLYMEPGEKHAFIAVEDCSLLLTILFNPS